MCASRDVTFDGEKRRYVNRSTRRKREPRDPQAESRASERARAPEASSRPFRNHTRNEAKRGV